jgi:hypothetical protein
MGSLISISYVSQVIPQDFIDFPWEVPLMLPVSYGLLKYAQISALGPENIHMHFQPNSGKMQHSEF